MWDRVERKSWASEGDSYKILPPPPPRFITKNDAGMFAVTYFITPPPPG
jgi:hypothetical protein